MDSRGVKAIACLLPAGWVLGLVHGVLSAWVSPIVLKLLMLAGVAALMVGVLKGLGEHVFENSRWKVLPLLGATLGVVTLWGSWCGWVWAASEFKYFLALHPIALYDVVRDAIENVEYTANSNGSQVAVSRASVRGGWLMEAAVIAGGGLLAGVFAAFGEDKDRWEL